MRWVLAIALGATVGCQRAAPPPSPPRPAGAGTARQDPNARLDELVREHIDATLAASPTTATWLGVHSFDDRLDDASPEAQSREVGRLRSLLQRLGALRDGDLDANHRIDRALLEREARLALLDIDGRPLERNPIRYADLAAAGIDELLAREFAPLPERLHAVNARLLKLRPLFDEARRNLRNPPELATRKAIEILQGMRGFVAETLPSVVAAVGDDKVSAEFRFAQADALRSLDDALGWMQRDLLPRSKGEFALGRERFLERLRVSDGIELPPEQLLALAEKDMRSLHRRYEETARQIAPGKAPADAPRVLEDDHGAPEQLLPSVEATLGQIAGFVHEHELATVPAARPTVTPMPPFLWGFAELSAPGPLETRWREARFYVDPVDRAWNAKKRDEHLRAFNRPSMVIATLHGALPGNWLLGEAARAAPTPMQRFARSVTFADGWSGYIEQEMLEEGFAEGDLKVRLASEREALVMACRMVSAIRLHAFGAKVEDAVKIFTEEAWLDEYAARREAERCAFDPFCLAPALGRLEILRLRDDVRAERGDAFRLGEFHDQLLAHGMAPVEVLRRVLLPDDDDAPL